MAVDDDAAEPPPVVRFVVAAEFDAGCFDGLAMGGKDFAIGAAFGWIVVRACVTGGGVARISRSLISRVSAAEDDLPFGDAVSVTGTIVVVVGVERIAVAVLSVSGTP